MHSVKVINAVSEKGLKLFGDGYAVGQDQGDPDAIVVRSSKVDPSAFPRLIAVARAGAGVNNIDVAKATERGIPVFNTPGANANAVAELVFAMLGIHARNIDKALAFTAGLAGDDAAIAAEAEKTKSRFAGFELAGKTLGVIGLGKIGVIIANIGIAKGMRVVGFDAFPTAANMHQLDARTEIVRHVEDVLKAADIVTVHVPLVPATRGLIGRERLAIFKEGGILVNYAREEICDSAAVLEALESGGLAAYLTDFPTKALLGDARVLCTPHLGASTAESEENCAVMAVRQLKAYLETGNVANSVNFPAVEAPLRDTTICRLAIANRDVPDMIASVAHVLGKAGINIQAFVNASNGAIGYNLVDLERDVSEDIVGEIRNIEGVLRVRHIRLR